MLTTKGTLVNDGATLLYRASTYDLRAVRVEAALLPNTPPAKSRAASMRAHVIWRVRSRSRRLRHVARERKKVEMLFAHLKRILKLDRLRLRRVHAAPRTSSSSPPPPRTSGNSPSSSPYRSWPPQSDGDGGGPQRRQPRQRQAVHPPTASSST